METETILSAAEAVEYGEFKRKRRETEVALTLQKMIVDASRRETDKHALKSACDTAKKIHAFGVLVSPVNVAAARRHLNDSETAVICLVGGTGESLPAIKRQEAKRAMRMGAREIRLVLCYSALTGGNLTYLKREAKRVKKAVKRCALLVSLEDHTLGPDDIAIGTRAALESGVDGICVRGETELLARALETCGDRLRADVSEIENAEQLRLLMKAGASHATSGQSEKVVEELHRAAEAGAELVRAIRPEPVAHPVKTSI